MTGVTFPSSISFCRTSRSVLLSFAMNIANFRVPRMDASRTPSKCLSVRFPPHTVCAEPPTATRTAVGDEAIRLALGEPAPQVAAVAAANGGGRGVLWEREGGVGRPGAPGLSNKQNGGTNSGFNRRAQ